MTWQWDKKGFTDQETGMQSTKSSSQEYLIPVSKFCLIFVIYEVTLQISGISH
jgi:hypothetical protein